MKRTRTNFVKQVFYALAIVAGLFLSVSCEDKYPYDDGEPAWLGASIYDYLKNDSNYTYYVKLIKEAGYESILSKTGSKTLFVVSDSAFDEFFKGNEWGVTSFNQLSVAQKTMIINYSMIDNAYLIETLSNYNTGSNSEGSLIIGQAIRHKTSIKVIDTIPYEKGDQLPNGSYWNRFKDNGLYMLKDESSWPIVHFFQKMMDIQEMTDEDFKIVTGITRQKNDAYIFNRKVIKRDITCKNGYIHVLDGVLLPPKNMADYIQNEPNLSRFSSILDRFCAPYYSEYYTKEYKKNHQDFTDSVFVKKFYTKLNGSLFDGVGQAVTYYPNSYTPINPLLFLPFDPGWNAYHYGYKDNSLSVNTPMAADMATMIVPSNDAMDNYFNTGEGTILKDRFGSWENVPDKIVVMLVKKHMRNSFFGSLPSRFSNMLDNDGFLYRMTKSDIVGSYIGLNGLVYITNKVYPPIDFESVFGPVLFGSTSITRIFDYVIQNNRYRFFLNTDDSNYSFLVPTDEYMSKYIDPITITKTQPGALKFWYDTRTNTVKATVYNYDKVNNVLGDSVRTITEATFINNRLLKILDNHIVVGGFVPGKKVYITRGNTSIRVEGTGTDMTIEAGGDIKFGEKVHVKQVFDQINGKTYFIDKPIQPPLRSAYEVLSTTPEFKAFFDLLSGFSPSSKSVIFVNKTSYFGNDFVIRFFNNFHYTIYVPTNDAIQEAINNKIISPWISQPGITGINDMVPNSTQYNEAVLKLERFLRYHFQDNSVSVGSEVFGETKYQSAATKIDDKITHFNTYKNRYYKIGVTSNGTDLSLVTENNSTVNVVTQNNLYNIYTCDYIFDKAPSAYTDIKGTIGSGTSEYNTSIITTSSSAVIHQIDKVLLFE
jgi:uncharacterized surface protein with fasciclin (FAS1) repeats